MDMPIKARCKKCNNITEYKWYELLWMVINRAFFALGILFVISMVFIGPTRFVNTFSTAMLTDQAEDNMLELRHLALNYTTYDGFNSFEFSNDLMMNMPKMRYALASYGYIMHDVDETINYAGDCKAQSVVYAAMMMSVGYEAFVDCSVMHHHCVVKIPYQKFGGAKEMYMIVDPTADTAAIYNNSINHWEEPDKALRVIKYVKIQEEDKADNIGLDGYQSST